MDKILKLFDISTIVSNESKILMTRSCIYIFWIEWCYFLRKSCARNARTTHIKITKPKEWDVAE